MPASDVSFFVQQGSNESMTFVRDFLTEIRATNAQWRVGASCRLPRQSAAYQQRAAAAFDAAATYVIADPETRQMHLTYAKRGRGRDDYPYLKESDPSANRKRFVAGALQAQVQNGRDVLVSPWLVHSLSGTKKELDSTVDFATLAHADPQVQGRTLLVGAETTDAVMRAPQSRNAFLNELVEAPELPVFLRMLVNITGGPQQYSDEAALGGLRAAVESLTDNERPVLLPQSGLAGWVMLGFGAVAFGAGVQFSMQRNQPLRSGGGGGGGQAPLHWYFLPEFLGFVLAEELPQISNVPGAVVCTCPYCKASPPAPGSAFDKEAATKHFLWWCARLAEDVRRATNRADEVRRRLADAAAFWQAAQQAGVVLDTRSQPTHLEVWTRVAS